MKWLKEVILILALIVLIFEFSKVNSNGLAYSNWNGTSTHYDLSYEYTAVNRPVASFTSERNSSYFNDAGSGGAAHNGTFSSDPQFWSDMDYLYLIYSSPLAIVSSFRCPVINDNTTPYPGEQYSKHQYGKAADVSDWGNMSKSEAISLYSSYFTALDSGSNIHVQY